MATELFGLFRRIQLDDTRTLSPTAGGGGGGGGGGCYIACH